MDRQETPGGRLDRQWNELLQELRVTQTGGFLLGERAALGAGLSAAVACLGLWWALPVALLRRPASTAYSPEPPEDHQD